MKDLDIKALNGVLSIERRTDGGIGLYYEATEAPHNTLMLDKEQLIKMMGWLVTYIEEKK